MKVSELMQILSEYPADMNVVSYIENDYSYVGELKASILPVYNYSVSGHTATLIQTDGSCFIPKGETAYEVLCLKYAGRIRIKEYNKRDELSPDEVDAIRKENE